MVDVGKILAAGLGKLLRTVLATGSIEHRGWGQKINWMTLEDGFSKARAENKVVMVVIHKMTCTACMYQKRWFARSRKIQDLSKNFVMINLEMHEVPKSPDFFPDGNYVPRILFFTPTGRLMRDAFFPFGNPEYKYNYPGEMDLVHSMKNIAGKK